MRMSSFLAVAAFLAVGHVFSEESAWEPETAQFQAAIDRASAQGGGRVTVTRGVHSCGTLYLKSNVELHLEEGAVLQGGDRSACYDDAIPLREVHDDPGAVKKSSLCKAFVYAGDATNIAITGKGVIDCQGPKFFDHDTVLWERFWAKPTCPRPRMVVFVNCRGVRLEDATFRDCPAWTMWLRRCTDITVSRIRIEAEPKMINSDGIDFDCCRNVRMGDSFVSTGDDCLVLRAIRRGLPADVPAVCENVIVSNCVLSTPCQGVRIGCPSDDTIRNAVFRDIVFTGNNGIRADQQPQYLDRNDRGRIRTENILFENWKLDCFGFPFSVVAQPGVVPRDLGHMTFRNFDIRSKLPITVKGNAEAVVRDVTLDNIRIRTEAPRPFESAHVEGLRIIGCPFGSETADWTMLNAAARSKAMVPIRPGVPGRRPFWNEASKAFIHPPAFDIPPVDGCASYCFTLTDESGHRDEWLAKEPYAPIPADLWAAKAPGYYTLRCGSFDRRFYRAAVFKGPYPAGVCDYRTAAKRVYAAVFNLPQVKGWLTTSEPPAGYDLYCYPAKILSSMIRALVRHAQYAPQDSATALTIARRMADWLLEESRPKSEPLAHFPPTYWGDRRDIAVKYAGQNMLRYPAQAANAYLDLAAATDERKYRDAAVRIVGTYAKLQGDDGSWPLKVWERNGEPVRANRIVPGRYIMEMLDRVSALDRTVVEMRDRAFAYVLNGPVRTWNWDGQFEDMDPQPPYRNLQKGVAIDTAVRLFARGDVRTALELVDWCEDQFTVWSDPIHNMDWKNWKTPTALEQYDYYTPIDASMADMIRGFASAYRATGEPLYCAKAEALADNITRHQRPDGTIPTYFDSRRGNDWVNCMVYVAHTLELLASLSQ